MINFAARLVKTGCSQFSRAFPLVVAAASAGTVAATVDWQKATTMYEFSAKDVHGEVVELSKYKGKVCLIVNVACKCGFTSSNYTQLVDLHKKYKDKGLCVLAFPCNQFGGQEPGSEEEILKYIERFEVDFDMFSKVEVNGDNAHPLWKWLKEKQGGTMGSFIKWNFTKFLVDRDGVPVKRYAPTDEPKKFEEDIVKLL